jgi:ubiquinone/menaquinone biosynthesis C-methylase UbiE
MEAEPYYDQSAEYEWGRLERHRTEFAVTLKVLDEFLPAAGCSVLDIGGGPGRYSIELARQGYRVTLFDISGESLKLAQKKATEAGVSLESYTYGNALDLSELEGNSFDAVLLMGPLYHLLAEGDRERAIREAKRVLRPQGRLFAAFITRFAPFRHAACAEPEWPVENAEYAAQVLETGVHERPTAFAKAYFTHPDDIVPLMEGCGLETLMLIGCEGIVAGHEDSVNEMEGEAWERWVELNYRLGQEPSLYGASDHLLYVGEKRA